MSKSQDLKERLKAAIPSLVEDDFGSYEYSLYVVAYPEVQEWFKNNYERQEEVTTFTGNHIQGWNGGGKLCIEVPFGVIDRDYYFAPYFPLPVPTEVESIRREILHEYGEKILDLMRRGSG